MMNDNKVYRPIRGNSMTMCCWFPTEEPDEDEEDENTEESDEEDSDEDLTEKPQTASTARPPYSIIPPPPVWVQRNQGLSKTT